MLAGVEDGFLGGGGDMGARIRAHDWTATPLGPPERWPQSLRSALSICLHSSFPTAIYWGPDLRLLYNDAWAPVPAERHPWALGRPGREVWADIWDVVEPQMRHVLETGRGFSTFDQHLPMERGGQVQETYWNYSLTPIRGENGTVAGIFNQGHEVTDRVVGERQSRFLFSLSDTLRALSDPRAIIAAAQQALGDHLRASRVGYGEVDDGERFFTTGQNWTDGSVPSREGTHDLAQFGPDVLAALQAGQPLLIPDVARDPRTSSPGSLAAFASIDVRAVLTATLVKDGRMRAALYAHAREPRPWSERESQLVIDVAERTWSAVERARAETELRESETRLRESEARFRNMADHSPVMLWVTEPEGGCIYLNRPWYAFTGQTRLAAEGFGWLEAVHPDDAPRAAEVFLAANAARRPFRIEYRLRRFDGDFRWAIDTAAPRFGSDGGFLGYVGSVIDIQDRYEAEESVRASELALRTERDRAQLYLQVAEVMILVLDETCRVRTINRRGADILGYDDPAALVGCDWPDLALPASHRAEMRAVFAAMIAGDGDVAAVYENPIVRVDGTERLIAWRNTLLRDADGRVIGTVSSGDDVTEERLAVERERLLSREIDHRAKNLLAVVQSVVQLTRAEDIATFKQAVTGRIQSLARTHGLLAAARWEGADLRQLITDELAPYGGGGVARATIDGPALRLSPAAAQSLALVVHELATNSAKYGSLSAPDGAVLISWRTDGPGEPRLDLRWSEAGGPPVSPPTRRGFGSIVLLSSVERQLQGSVHLDWRPGGLSCHLSIPLKEIVASRRDTSQVRLPAARRKGEAQGPELPLRVLVLEDEALVAAQIEDVLTNVGHSVTMVSRLSDAFDAITRNGFDVCLLDINVGGERSYPLADLLLSRGVPYAFCSGYGESADLPSGMASVPVVPKPFDPRALTSTIADLGRRAAEAASGAGD